MWKKKFGIMLITKAPKKNIKSHKPLCSIDMVFKERHYLNINDICHWFLNIRVLKYFKNSISGTLLCFFFTLYLGFWNVFQRPFGRSSLIYALHVPIPYFPWSFHSFYGLIHSICSSSDFPIWQVRSFYYATGFS